VNFALDDDLAEFQAQVRAFAQRRLAPHYQADDARATFRREALAELAGLGLLGLRIPEEHGGQGASCLAAGVACEEVAYADFNMGYVLNNTALIGDVLASHGSAAQRERHLPPIASGEVLPALCLTEPEHGTDAGAIQMRADRDGDGWRLTGEKTSITFGMTADTAIVFARTGGPGARGVSAFYVPLDAAFVERSEFRDLGNLAIGRASLHFDGLPVDREDLIGGEGAGFVQVMQAFDYARALISLICLGSARAALDAAFAYAADRHAFGQPIGRFQGVSFPLVEHLTHVRAARLLCLEALWRRDRGLPHTAEANMVKWWAPKLAFEAIHQALLTHGHAAYSEELPLAQRLRDVIGLEIGDGTAQVAKLVVARQVLGREAAP
jgi:cyclohexanecarboxyl-CoA dehydrogenase